MKYTYETVIDILQSNHFYPAKEVNMGKTKKITGLDVTVPVPIRANEIVAALQDVLEGIDCTVAYMPNHGVISIKLTKNS